MEGFKPGLILSVKQNISGKLPATGLVLLAALVLSGCEARSASVAEVPPPVVDVAPVILQALTLTETLTGRLEAPQTVQLRPRVSGYIETVAFEEGEWVEEGDLLFQIDPRPYQARVDVARAELAEARSQLQLADTEAQRAARLRVGEAISQEEYDQRQAALINARAQVGRAEAALELAELDLHYTRVLAPVSGRAGRAVVTRGNLARADETLLTTVVSVHPLYVYFEAGEALKLARQTVAPVKGHPPLEALRIGLSGEEGFPHQGRLDYVGNRFDANTGTLQYRAVLDNREGLLRPGQFARVQMPIARLDQALLVRREALLTDQDRRYVYVLDEGDRVSRRDVLPGPVIDDLVLIREGLQAGDRVVINGLHQLPGSGIQVDPREVSMQIEPGADPTLLAAAEPTQD